MLSKLSYRHPTACVGTVPTVVAVVVLVAVAVYIVIEQAAAIRTLVGELGDEPPLNLMKHYVILSCG